MTLNAVPAEAAARSKPMLYHVARNGQSYGPYTLEDLQKYVAGGNVLPTDLAKSDEMAEWVTVAQLLGGAAVPPGYQPPVVAPYAVSNVAIYPDAPNLSWGLVLLFALFTCSLFMFVWNLILAAWLRRVQPNSRALFYYATATVLGVLQVVFGTHAQTHVHVGSMWTGSYYHVHPGSSLLGFATWIVRLIARFNMRSELEQHFNGPEPVGLSLSGVMTFFFGGLYFQYHLNRINELKHMARYRGAAI
jgi:hypothetical protein